MPAALSALAAWQQAPRAAIVLALFAVLLLTRLVGDSAAAMTCLLDVLGRYGKSLQIALTPEAAPEAASSTPDVRARMAVMPRTATPLAALAEIDDDDEIVEAPVVGGERS